MNIRIDVAQLLGLIIGLLIHGCYLAVFGVTMYILHHKKLQNKLIVYALVVLFVLSTTNVVIGIVDTYAAFITYRDVPGTLARLNDYKNALPVSANLLYDFSVLVADLLLVWRLSIVWPDNRLIFLAIGMLLLAMTGCGGTIAFFEVKQVMAGDDRYVTTINIASMVGFSVVLMTNLVVTGLIAWKLWQVGRSVAALGANSHLIYHRIVNIFISSGGIYVAVIFLQVIIYAFGMNSVIYFFLRCNPSIVALFPTLIVLQLNLTSLQAANRSTNNNQGWNSTSNPIALASTTRSMQAPGTPMISTTTTSRMRGDPTHSPVQRRLRSGSGISYLENQSTLELKSHPSSLDIIDSDEEVNQDFGVGVPQMTRRPAMI